MNNFSDIATQMNVCKTMAYALPRFYERTGISVQFTFVHNPKTKEMEVNVGFTNLKEVLPKHYEILLQEIQDAEALLLNEYIFNESQKHENLKQFIYQHKENTYQILQKHKERS